MRVRGTAAKEAERLVNGVSTFRGPLLPSGRSGPLPPALGRWTGFALIVAAHAVEERYARALHAMGISLRDFVVMAELARQQGLPQGTLAYRVGLTPARVSEQLLVLDKNGYVERQIHELDLRQRLIWLTPSGQRVHEKAAQRVDGLDRGWLAGLELSERAAFTAALRRLPPARTPRQPPSPPPPSPPAT